MVLLNKHITKPPNTLQRKKRSASTRYTAFRSRLLVALCSKRNMKKVTIYIDHVDDDKDFIFMHKWFEKWKDSVRIENYSSGGWEHIWDIEGSEEAIAEIPKEWIC